MKILVGVDGSEGGQRALRWAADEARARGCPLTALLAFGFYGRPREVQESAGAGDQSQLEKASLDILAQAVAVAHVPPSVHLETAYEEPVDALIERVSADDTLVVGARGLGPVRRLLMGSVSMHVVRHAPCATVVVRPDHSEMAQSGEPRQAGVVVGVDGSNGSVLALRWAAEHARHRGLPLHIVQAWSVLSGQGSRLSEVLAAPAQRDAAQAELNEIVEREIAADQRDSVTVSMIDGQPAAVLLDAAKDAELLVVGSRGEGGFARLLLGSTSASCLEHSHGSVAVVPEPHGSHEAAGS